MCSQERAISDTIAALGDGADHERNKHAPQRQAASSYSLLSTELSMPFSSLGLAASRTPGPLTEDSERVTHHPEKGLGGGPEVAFSEIPREAGPTLSLGKWYQ